MDTNTINLPSFVAINFQTANEVRKSICEIGITEVINGEIQKPKSWEVQPEYGFCPEEYDNMPTFPEVWKEILHIIENKIVITHKASFHMYALRDTLDMYNIKYPNFVFFCTEQISRCIIKDTKNYSLQTLLNYFNIDAYSYDYEFVSSINSYGCATLMLECLKLASININDLEKTFNLTAGKFSSPNIFSSNVKTEHNHINYKKLADEAINEARHNLNRNEISQLYGKTISFTGGFISGSKEEIYKKVANAGGIPNNITTQNTDILIVGGKVESDKTTGQMKKAMKYNITILHECDLLNMFNSESISMGV